MRKWDFVTQTHNKKRVIGGKTCYVKGYAGVKSVGKDAQNFYKNSTCSRFINLHTRLSLKKRRNEGFKKMVYYLVIKGDNTPFYLL